MRTMNVESWDATNKDGEPVKEDLIDVLSIVMTMQDPQKMPRGYSAFRTYNKITKAFEEAKKTKVLKLEDAEYAFIKKLIESDVPAIWGANKNIPKQIDAFMEVKAEE